MPVRTQQERVDHRMAVWGKWISKEIAPVNGWWSGWCPLHDHKRQELGSAEFNFLNGTYHCTNTPRCHHRGGMSLSQLADAVVKRV